MTYALGVDTGGTYTDAVLIKDETEVIASAKSLTTRHDLAIGVGGSIRAVLADADIAPEAVSLAALSTTLATNALVEGQGGRVALIYIGFSESDLDRHGLRDALRGDPALVIAGGHTHAGAEATPLDTAALETFLTQHGAEVSGFAIASLFATRNPAHEVAAAEIITRLTGAPVTCSYQLSAKLNGPKRAVTAVLNARLIGMIDQLIGRAQETLRGIGITAPMMVVRGDGALMSAEQARARPIETILSGPAASIVGAHWLTGLSDAIVSDIGGTTTDVALIRDGKPAIDPKGAQVGGFRTMVEAVAMRTTGLGGDSQVHVNTSGLGGGVTLGPRRLIPISLIAQEAPDVVHRALDQQMNAPIVGEYDGRFLRALPSASVAGLSEREAALLARVSHGVHPMGDILRNRVEQGAMNRLVDQGLVQIAGITPSDASHAVGGLTDWDRDAALKALEVFARRRIGSGDRLAPDAKTLAQMIIDQLTAQTSTTLLETAFAEDHGFEAPADQLARHELLRRGLSGHRGLLALDAALNCDVIGLGASAASYYPAVGQGLRCNMVLPRHADVANAVGAVVGRITVRHSGTVTTPAEGKFRAHMDSGPQDFTSSGAALTALEEQLTADATRTATEAGAAGLQLNVSRDVRMARVESREVFVEATLTVEASGRPRIAHG